MSIESSGADKEDVIIVFVLCEFVRCSNKKKAIVVPRNVDEIDIALLLNSDQTLI